MDGEVKNLSVYGTNSIVKCTHHLRWVTEAVQKPPRLQQAWSVTEFTAQGVVVRQDTEWRDVPTEYVP